MDRVTGAKAECLCKIERGQWCQVLLGVEKDVECEKRIHFDQRGLVLKGMYI